MFKNPRFFKNPMDKIGHTPSTGTTGFTGTTETSGSIATTNCLEVSKCLTRSDFISFQSTGFVGYECQFSPNRWELVGGATFSKDITELLLVTKNGQTTSAAVTARFDQSGVLKFNYISLFFEPMATFTLYINDVPTVLNLAESFADIPVTKGQNDIKLVYVNFNTDPLFSEFLVTIGKFSVEYNSCVDLTIPSFSLNYRYLNFYDSNVLSVPKSNSRFISAGLSNYGLTTESFMNVAYLISEPISLRRIFAAFKNVKLNHCATCTETGTIKLQLYYSKCENGKYLEPVASPLSLSIKISANGNYCVNETGAQDLDLTDLIAIGVTSDNCIASFRLAVNIGSIDLSDNQVTSKSQVNTIVKECKSCNKK